jgi:hypothetical protein
MGTPFRRFDPHEYFPHLVECQDVRIALANGALPHGRDPIQLRVKFVPDAVAEQSGKVVPNLRLGARREIEGAQPLTSGVAFTRLYTSRLIL